MKIKPIYVVFIVIGAIAIIGISLVIALSIKSSPYSYGSIGVIEINDVIVSSKTVVKDLKNFCDDRSIAAILVRVDSPGGGVAASQEIYEQLKKTREQKKIVVSMGALAASGGYYVSLPADVIVANPGTITGSIGVIMEFMVISDLLKKIGVDFEVVKSREFKDTGSPYRKMSDREKGLLKDMVLDVYDQFVTATCESRELDRDTVLKYADGRVMTGRQAKTIGFVDTLGTFEDAVKICGDLIGIEKPVLVYPPRRLSIIEYFTEPIEEMFKPKLQYLWK
ncbi:MAG TPA: signal peptide peptidase SppA [bacterium]